MNLQVWEYTISLQGLENAKEYSYSTKFPEEELEELVTIFIAELFKKIKKVIPN